MQFAEFDSFRAELRALAGFVENIEAQTVRDDSLRERFRTLFRIWASSVRPTLKPHLQNERELFKLSGEIEKLARLSSKFQPVAEYRKHLRFALQLSDELIIQLPATGVIKLPSRQELFIPTIPDLPVALVPNAIFGWRSRMERFLAQHPYDESVFIMIRYRERNAGLIKSVKKTLAAAGLYGVLAADHHLTDDLYNPVACLLCCARGIAIFDRAEKKEVFNPNVAYELGMLHLLGRQCLILKHGSLKSLQTDILMKLYTPFTGPVSVGKLTKKWCDRAFEPNPR